MTTLTLTWDNLQRAADWCGAADLYDTRYLLLVPTPEGEEVAQVGDTIVKHGDASFSVIRHPSNIRIPTMKSKSDPRQLTLTLTFTNPTPSVLRNLSTLLEIADESNETGDAAGIRHSDGRASDPCNKHVTTEQKPLRDRLRQLAGCIAVATKQDWHTVWVLAYHRFFKLTGRHPVTESIRLALPTHLDFVFTDPSWPGILHNVLEEMLTGEGV